MRLQQEFDSKTQTSLLIMYKCFYINETTHMQLSCTQCFVFRSLKLNIIKKFRRVYLQALFCSQLRTIHSSIDYVYCGGKSSHRKRCSYFFLDLFRNKLCYVLMIGHEFVDMERLCCVCQPPKSVDTALPNLRIWCKHICDHCSMQYM